VPDKYIWLSDCSASGTVPARFALPLKLRYTRLFRELKEAGSVPTNALPLRSRYVSAVSWPMAFGSCHCSLLPDKSRCWRAARLPTSGGTWPE
jgi:hypothetical protein